MNLAEFPTDCFARKCRITNRGDKVYIPIILD